jgi:hypothetical protein
MKHSNLWNEIDEHHDEDKWWKRGAIALFIIFIGYIVARGVTTLIWGV